MQASSVETGYFPAKSTPNAPEWVWSIVPAGGRIHHRHFRDLHTLWKQKQCESGLPKVSDFSGEELLPWLGLLSLAQPMGEDYELDLLGCSLTDAHGRECSRVTLSDASFGPVGSNARGMLETVTGMGVIALPCGSTWFRGQEYGWHGIVLPLADGMAFICLFVTD